MFTPNESNHYLLGGDNDDDSDWDELNLGNDHDDSGCGEEIKKVDQHLKDHVSNFAVHIRF